MPDGSRSVGGYARGASYVLAGFSMWRRRPGLMLLGMLPALLVLVVVLAALATLWWHVGDLVGWATPFADDWAAGLRSVVRAGLVVLVVLGSVLLAAVTFTGLTLAVGDPFYERIWLETELMLGGEQPAGGLGLWRSVRDGLGLAGLGVLAAVALLLVGLVPVVGAVVGVVLGVAVSGRLLAVELLGRPLEGRGLDRAARRALLRGRGPLLLGFGTATQVCFLVPLGAIVVMPAAVVGATMLAREVLDAGPGPTGQTRPHGSGRAGARPARRPPRADSPMLRRCTATMSRVGTGSWAGTATRSSPSCCRPNRGTRAIPRPARTRARWESNSSDSCAILGRRPVPSYIRVSHSRQIVPSGVAIHSSSTRSCGVTRGAGGEGVLAVHDHVGDVAATERRSRWSGTASGDVAPAVREPESTWPVATRSTVSQGSRSAQGQPEVGWASRSVADDGGDQPAHRGGERGEPQAAGHARRPGGAGPASSTSRSPRSRPPASTQVAAGAVSMTPRPTRSSRGTPVCARAA